jgi:glycerophosphoryl diester phosphodiesterase
VSAESFVVFGHRGAAALAPENTVAGLRAAAAAGIRWVEVDVQLAADREPIVIHDFTLDRTTNGRGRVARARVERIADLDAGAWLGEDFRGERLPTLAAAIAAMTELGLAANFEIKAGAARAAMAGRIVAEAIGALWPRASEPPIISSFSRRALAAARAARRDVPRALLLRRLTPGWARRARALDCAAVHVSHAALDAGRVAAIRDAGFPVRCYTVNDRPLAELLRSWGVTGVFTDRPDLLADLERP